MMDFRLSEVQSLMAATVDSLVADHIKRGAGPWSLWAGLADMGLLGAGIAEEDGGSGGCFEDLAVIVEGLGRGGGTGLFVPVVVVGAGLVSRLGNEAQRAALLRSVVSGTATVVLAHHEAPHEAGLISARATRSADGWRLTGEKTFVPGGDVADRFIVSACTSEGVALFIVPATVDGLQARAVELYDGNGAAHLTLDGCLVPVDAQLGDVVTAGAAVDWALDRANAAYVNEAVGLMSMLCDRTRDHIKTRKQFGETLAGFQVVKHRMVDMFIELELARSMAMMAAVSADAIDPTVRARDVSGAKAAVGKAGRRVGQSAIQLHGALGLTRDYPVGPAVKRLTLIERIFGDTSWHLARYAKLSA